MGAAERILTPAPPFDLVCDSTADVDEWLRLRQQGIGASEIAAALGVSRYKTPLRLYLEKTGQLEPEDLSTKARVDWGKRTEQLIARRHALRSGHRVEWDGRLVRSQPFPWAQATLDARVWLPSVTDDCPAEIKWTETWNAETWGDGRPLEYWWQTQHQMLVTGASHVVLIVQIGGDWPAWEIIDRDEAAIRRIIRAGGEFWDRVVTRTPPPPQADDASILSKVFPVDDGSSKSLAGAFLDVADTLEGLKAQRKLLEAQIAEAEAHVKAELGAATFGHLPDGRVFSWKTQERAGYTVAPTTSRVLRLAKPKKGR